MSNPRKFDPSQRYVQREFRYDDKLMRAGTAALPSVLKRMGFPGLRKGQDKVVFSILAGSDVLCVLPTAGGKTACYVIPTLALKWKTLIFSPLKALMSDQVRTITNSGGRVGCIMSGQDAVNEQTLQKWSRGELDIMLVAPERLRNAVFMEHIRYQRPDMVVMDEAHTLSQWSKNFRSAYCDVGDFITEFTPKLVAAFTATCPPEVEKDIRRVLCLQKAPKLVYYPRRNNLTIKTLDYASDFDVAQQISRIQGKVLVYCATQRGTEELAGRLQMQLGEDVGFYHGGLPEHVKSFNMEAFTGGRLRIMTATNAFGMGVDIPDIRAVIHYDIPDCIEAWAQEFGRAGRDGKPSLCLTYYSDKGRSSREFLLRRSNPTEVQIRNVFRTLDDAKDSTGMVNLTRDQIVKTALGERGAFAYDACIQFLQGSKVVERIKREEKVATITFKNHVTDRKFEEFYRAVHTMGESGMNPNMFEVDLVALANRLDVKETTLRARCRAWANEAGLIDFVAPERAQPIRVIGTEDMIDYDQASRLLADAMAKLERLIWLITEVPDAHKHQAIEKEFCVDSSV